MIPGFWTSTGTLRHTPSGGRDFITDCSGERPTSLAAKLPENRIRSRRSECGFSRSRCWSIRTIPTGCAIARLGARVARRRFLVVPVSCPGSGFMAHLFPFDQRLATSLRERFARRLSGLRVTATSNGRPLPKHGDDGVRMNGHPPGVGESGSVMADASLIEDLLADVAEAAIETGSSNGTEFPQFDEAPSTRPELASSDTRYRSLLEISPDAIAILQEGKVAFVNEAALRMVGANSPDEIVGRALNEHIHPDDLARSLERQRELASGAATLPATELRLRRLDGHYILVETRAGACIFHGASAIQIVARDITERKREELYLEEQNRILERIATGAPFPRCWPKS